jgi:hypothetical protein
MNERGRPDVSGRPRFISSPECIGRLSYCGEKVFT